MSWLLFTLLAAFMQTMRNVLQRDLVSQIGLAAGVHVRFLFGFPFALLFLLIIAIITGKMPFFPSAIVWGWMIMASLTQMIGTAFMLQAMEKKSFVMVICYTKVEPIFVAFLAAVFLGEALSLAMLAAISLTVFGIFLTVWPQTAQVKMDFTSLFQGLGAAGFFALSSICFRGAIDAVPHGNFLFNTSLILTYSLAFQALLLAVFLWVRQRDVLLRLLRLWRGSLGAGFSGALASQLWFFAFALAPLAKVRTLGLIEVFFALIVSGKIFSETLNTYEKIGLVIVFIGLIGLLNIV